MSSVVNFSVRLLYFAATRRRNAAFAAPSRPRESIRPPRRVDSVVTTMMNDGVMPSRRSNHPGDEKRS